MRIVNLTPHSVHLHIGDEIVTLPSEGLARVTTIDAERDPIVTGSGPIPVVRTTFGSVEGLPEPVDGAIYVVSLLVAQASPRPDVFSPGDLLRNEAGVIIGCTTLRASC